MRKVIFALILIAVLSLAAFSAAMPSTHICCETPHEVYYTLDRMEEGANGEEIAVIEIYDATADSIRMITVPLIR